MDKTISVERSVILNPETKSYDLVQTSLFLSTGTILAKLTCSVVISNHRVTGDKLELLQEYEPIKEHIKHLLLTLEEYKTYSYDEKIEKYLTPIYRNEKLKDLGL